MSNWLDWCEEHFTPNLLTYALYRFLVKLYWFFTSIWFPTVNISHYCVGWNQAKSTGIHGVAHPDSGGSQHLPIWAASACKTMSHPLWWQHNSSLVFSPHVFTSTQQCSIIQIIYRCRDDKANTCHVMWLIWVVLFEDCAAFLIVIFTLSFIKRKWCFAQKI